MKKMITLFEALEENGYNLDSLTFQEGVNLMFDIETLVLTAIGKKR